MTDEKKLQKLSRTELLELLLIQTQETERLREKLKKADRILTDRYLRVQTAGDLAHAVLEINGVLEAAQAAAKQYLDNIVAMEQETREKCSKMISDAKREAERIRQDAPAEPETAYALNDMLDEIYEILDEDDK